MQKMVLEKERNGWVEKTPDQKNVLNSHHHSTPKHTDHEKSTKNALEFPPISAAAAAASSAVPLREDLPSSVWILAWARGEYSAAAESAPPGSAGIPLPRPRATPESPPRTQRSTGSLASNDKRWRSSISSAPTACPWCRAPTPGTFPSVRTAVPPAFHPQNRRPTA